MFCSQFMGGKGKAGGGKKVATIAAKFKGQLQELSEQLRSTQPHYIRCIKPNAAKRAREFDARMSLQQLTYSGVMEIVKIRRMG